MNFYFDIKVNAATVSVTKVTLSQSTAEMTVGSSLQLTASVYPTNATNRNVNWSSSNTSVASVSYGKVEAKTAGTATITCRAADGSGCYATCRVSVTEAAVRELVISDKEGLTEDSIPSVANVTYERLFYEGWNSVCVPFVVDAATFGIENMRMALPKEFVTVDGNVYLTYRMVERVESGTPCLIYAPKEQESKVRLERASLTNKPDNSGLLQGTFCQRIIADGCYKLSTSDGELGFSKTRTHIAVCKPFRAYIKK